MSYYFSRIVDLTFEEAVQRVTDQLKGGLWRFDRDRIDPVASMQAIENPELAGIAEQVRTKLKSVIEKLA